MKRVEGYAYILPIASLETPLRSPLAARVRDTGIVLCNKGVDSAVRAAELRLDGAIEGRLSAEEERSVWLELKERLENFHPPAVCRTGGRSFARYHAAPFVEVVKELERWGLDVLVDWSPAAVAQPGVSSLVSLPASLASSWARIWDWLMNNDGELTIRSLSGPARGRLRWAEAKLGLTLPADLRAFYAMHDGQFGLDRPLFADGFRFLSLAGAMWHCRQLEFPDSDPRHSESWFCFGQNMRRRLVVNTDSWRVCELDEHLQARSLAESFEEFLGRFAESLVAGEHRLQRVAERTALHRIR